MRPALHLAIVRTSARCLGILALLDCRHPSLPEPIDYAEHCGVAGPLRLLGLPADKALVATLRVGDRLYHTVGSPLRDYFVNGIPVPTTATFTGLSTWSTGLCGETPVHLGDDLGQVFTRDRWPDLALACDDSMGIVRLDPTGMAPPHVLFPTHDCSFDWSDLGVVAESSNGATADLTLYPYPDDPITGVSQPELLLADVKGGWAHTWPDAVHTLDVDANLVRVDLADRKVTVEQTGVLAYTFSDDRRYLVWADQTDIQNGQGPPAGIVSLRDSMTGASVAIGETTIAFNPDMLRWSAQGWLIFDTLGHQRIFRLPDLSFIDLPEAYEIDESGPADGQWLVINDRFGGHPWLARLDLADGTMTTLFTAYGQVRDRDHDIATVLAVRNCCVEDLFTREGALWRVPLDGTDARKLATRASSFATRPDPSRLITAVDIAVDRIGTLLLVDLDTRDEQTIDDHVFVSGLPLTSADDPTVLIYSVQDGQRSGIWTARVPPAPASP